MSKLILIRGLPGSGKTTRANEERRHYPEMVHLEADMFFEADGSYKFNPLYLKTAHDWCYSNAVFNLLAGKDVIVSNSYLKS